MGCYKTTTGIWLFGRRLKRIKNPRRVLIITSKTGKSSYYDVLPDMGLDDEFFNVTTTEYPIDFPPGIYVAHYECFRNKSEFRIGVAKNKVEWDMCILDEAHRIKNTGSQQSKHIHRLRCKNRHVMTGTPFINKPDEIWNLLKWLYPNEYGSYRRFARNYCIVEKDDYGFEHYMGIKPEKRQQFHKLILKRGVMRTREEVFKDMPPVLPVKNVYVDLSTPQKQLYHEIYTEMKTRDANGEILMAPTVLSQLTRMRQICVATPIVKEIYYDEKTRTKKWKLELQEPSTKLDALMDIMEEASHPVVIFSVFRDTHTLIKHRFNQASISHIHMQAEDSDGIRLEKIRKFQQGNTKAFLITLALGSESITLTAADTVIFIDRSWSPKDNKQALARVTRPPQKLPVQPIHINARDTVDEYIEETLDRKESYWRQVFGSLRS